MVETRKFKILAIDGSNHNGNTARIIRKFADELKKKIDVQFEILNVRSLNLPFCIGCTKAIIRGEDRCPHHEIMQPIVKKMEDCDAMIIGTPVYSLQVTGMLKNFLDHLAYILHRPNMFGKFIMPIVVQGIVAAPDVVKYLKKMTGFLGFKTGPSLILNAPPWEWDEKTTKKADEKIKKSVDKFIKFIKSDRYPHPKFAHYLRFIALKAVNPLNESYFPLDHKQFVDNGWYSAEYYYPVRINIFIKGIGWLISRMILFSVKRDINKAEIKKKKLESQV